MSQRAVATFSLLGDSALLAVCALAVLLYLWIDEDRRANVRSWLLLSILCAVLTVASKVAFYLLAIPGAGPWRMHSPSGHVALSTAVYGGCALLLASGRSLPIRSLIWAGLAVLLVALAQSRLTLGLHSVAEAAAGFAIGLICLVVYGLSRPAVPTRMSKPGLLIALLVLVDLARLAHVDGEAVVGRLAHGIQGVLMERRYVWIEGASPNRKVVAPPARADHGREPAGN